MKKAILKLPVWATLMLGSVISSHASFPAGANNIASAPDVILSQVASNPTDLFNFTFETNEVSHDYPNGGNAGNHSAWWKWTPVENGFCTVDTIISVVIGGSTPLKETSVAVYTLTNPGAAVSVTNLTNVASNNNFGDYSLTSDYTLSKTTFYAQAGKTYYIAADGGWSGAVTNTARTVGIRVKQVPALPVTLRGLWDIDDEVLGKRGFITVTLTASGSYSASFVIGAAKHTLTGYLDVDGTSVRSIPRPVPAGAPLLTPITIKIDASQDSMIEVQMDGVTRRNNMVRQAIFPKTSPSVLAATYNIANRSGSGFGDPGRGYLRTTISPTGAVNMVGVLYDGTKVTAASALGLQLDGTDEYEAPAFVLLHGNKGCVALDSYIEVSSTPATNYCGIYADFIRPAPSSPSVTFYPGGMIDAEYMDGVPYVKPATGSRVLNFLNTSDGLGTLTLYGATGEMAAPIQEGFALSTSNKATFISALKKPSLTINPATGIVTGSITTTDTILGVTKPRVRKLTGLIFTDAYTPGTVYLTGHASGVTKNVMFDVVPATVAP
jgi:hypothetical protein